MKWLKDSEFIRGKAPMTKQNIRMLALSHLSISKGDSFLDVGGGTGSLSIEAARLGAAVYSIERDSEAFELMTKNSLKHNVELNMIFGEAPTDLPNIVFDSCFIGGSRGRLKDIVEYLQTNLKSGGVVVANFIVIKNAMEFKQCLEEYGFNDIEFFMLQSSQLDSLGMLRADNPIIIIKGVKK